MTAQLHSQSVLPPTLTIDGEPRGLGALIALASSVETVLPLTRVKVRAHIVGAVCRTVVEQVFRNTLERPMEAVYLFPLPVDAAVTEVELHAGEVVVRADCRERAEAQATYDKAVKDGHRAALLTQERADVHTLRVANLPAGEQVSVRVVLVQRLDAVDGALQWRFPTVIAPRYLPGEPIGHDGLGVLPDSTMAPDASRLQPPLRLEGGAELDLEVEIAGPVRRLASSLHAVSMDLEDGAIRVAPSTKATLNKDFLLSFHPGAGTQVTTRAWTDGGHTVVLCSAPSDALAASLPRDAVFVIDVSGSMGGAKMKAARTALRSAVRGLMPGDRFNMIAFSNDMQSWRPDLCAYDDASLAKAERWIQGLSAGGGTAMLEPIKAALAGSTPEGRVRTVLLITDGQAWDEAQLMAAVGHRRGAGRLFTMGIDTAVNESMLKGLARVGGGTCELLTPADDMEAAVARLEARFGSPVADAVRVRGAVPARAELRTIFAGRPAYMVVEGAPAEVVVEGRTAAGPFERTLVPTRVQAPLGALWARERVASLEDRLTLHPHEEEGLRPAILDVALKHSIACKYTAFVAVERSTTVDGEPVQVVQATELPEQWSDDAYGGAVGGAPVPVMSMQRSARPQEPMMAKAMAMSSPSAELAAPMPSSAPMPKMRRASPKRKRSVSSLLDGARRMFAAPEPVREEADDMGALVADEEASAGRPTGPDVASSLAQLQGANGSFSGDAMQTAAALLALVLLGHTRLAGLRRRVVLKAANWLEAHRGNAVVDDVLDVLAQVEAGGAPAPSASVRATLEASGAAGSLLARVP